jgi:manganese transport protein
VLTSRRSVMGPDVNGRNTMVLGTVVCAAIVALNVVLLVLPVTGS